MSSTIRMPHPGSKISDFEPEKFISRELSWLDFNGRVLEEAAKDANLLLDRLKFIAIFSSNMDEFFMVRVAGLRQLIRSHVTTCDPAGNTPAGQWRAALKKITAMAKKQYQLLYGEILPELEEHGIFIRKFSQLSAEGQIRMRKLFTREILPALTPLAVDPSHPFPLLNSGTIELALKLHFPKSGKCVTAFVEVPELLSRFIPIPDDSGNKQEFLLIEDLIAENIPLLFPGGRVTACQVFRITRDMDYSIDNDGEAAEDLLHELQDKLRQRSRRSPVRLEFSSAISDKSLQKYLSSSLDLEDDFCFTHPGALCLKQFTAFASLVNRPDLMEEAWQPVTPAVFSGQESIFTTITREKNILLAHPYHTFDPIVDLLKEAANDPDVLAIKQTLYRVSGNSPVVKALRRAAENGKQVTVLVELKARFDESNNIAWAELLDLSGAHVVYGVPGLKVHCKTLLIVRKEQGKLRRYVHFGTGNYNDRTATLYTDLSLLSCDNALADDAATLFNLLSGSGDPPDKWRAINTAPFDLRKKLVSLIENEITRGKKGRIIAKMNSFSDPELINLIHRAADAGVKIDLIVRGICCLRPRKERKNLRIISIIDRFLEHSRIYYFGSGEQLFCSSADWMPRNLDRRIEVMFPVTDVKLKKQITAMLEFHLKDSAKQRRLLSTGNYTRPGGKNGERSQKMIYDFWKNQR